MQPTPEQQQAILTRRNAIVVAGAGSGKTRVLVERYLTLLEENRDWSLNALVAITFTRKAAGEMRDRVRAALEKKHQSATDPDTRNRWSDLLGAMDSARITTIHGLCADLLRANAAEAQIDPDFGVLDDIESKILLSQAIDDTFRTIATTDHPALRVFDLFDPREVREVLTAELMGADLPDLPQDLYTHWRNQWLIFARDLFQLWLKHPTLYQAIEWLTDTAFPAGDKLAEVCEKAKRVLFALIDQPDPLKQHELLRNLGEKGVIKLNSGAKKTWGEDGLEQAKAILKGIRESADELLKSLGEPIGALDQLAAEIVPAWHALIRATQATYRAYKQRANRLDFNDLERLTAELLRDHRHVQRRYQGAEFQHLLVDEFQDTNSAQWEIVQALSGLTRSGSLFVVGDPKQSIYAFRGADVSVFHDVHDEIVRAGGEQIDLRRSFRTHAPLVNTLNRLFEAILQPDEHSPVLKYQVALGPNMDAHRLDAPNPDPALEVIVLDNTADKLGADVIRQWEARTIAERIHALVNDQRIIYDKERDQLRPIEYGDVAILFQSMKKTPIYEEAFRQMGLPFFTVAGSGYYDRQEVWDLLNLLTALHQPTDDLAVACALRSPLFQVSDDGLYALRLTKLPLWQALAHPDATLPADQQQRVAAAHLTLTELQRLAGRVTISELLREALTRTGYLATLTGLPNGALRRGNVEKLLGLAHSSGKITLGAFTAYLRDLTTREIREGDAALEVEGVVRLMTVHASKGLEFPLVILVDTSWQSKSKPSLITYRDGLCCKLQDEEGNWKQPFIFQRALKLQQWREEAERRRLLYVAATRAQDLLIICGSTGRSEKSELNGWLNWIMEVVHETDPDVLIRKPTYSPPTAIDRREETRSAWEILPPKATPIPPRLIRAIEPAPLLQTRHLAPSQITQIGVYVSEADEQARREARRRFRQSIFYDAPETIAAARYQQTNRVSARQVGEIVHEALRWWTLPFERIAPDQRRKLLLSYAWEQGITEQHDLDDAIHRAEGLLNGFMSSTLYRWIQDAVEAKTTLYRELPFVYEYDSHIIRGVIDILFRHPDGHWILADYKTGRVSWPDRASKLIRLQRHAQRYHLQLGIYAAAVSAQLGQTPKVYINYLSEGELFALPEAQWRSALHSGLQSAIQPLLDRY
ncbi:MAG: UvrD-helicase domain-containing protein [Anaerolineae bacterium]|nr:UvrD-helicase domain-containing protein [Anaerolineae bacterium]